MNYFCHQQFKIKKMKTKINKIDDIYPLTIVSVRYDSKIVIFNLDSDNEIIHNTQLSEEIAYHLEDYLDKKLSNNIYGIGSTLFEAFENFKEKQL